MKWKRYQIWTRRGLEWSKWFPYDGESREVWQLKNKQLNEYAETRGDYPLPYSATNTNK